MYFKDIVFGSIFILLFNSFIFPQKKNNLYSDILKHSYQIDSNSDLKKAAFFFSKKKWDSTLIYTQIELNILHKDTNSKDLINYLRGVSFLKKKVFSEAKNYLTLISRDFKFHHITEYYLAYINISLSKYDEAIKHLIPLSKKNNDELKYFINSDVLDNLVACFSLLKQFDKAEFYFLKNNQNKKDTLILIDNYTNRANLYYYNANKQNLAIEYFTKAYKLSKQINYNLNKISKYDKTDFLKRKRKAIKNMAAVEENNNNYKLALLYRKEYERYHDSINDQNLIYEVAKKEKEFALQQKQKEVDILQVLNELKETQRDIFLYSAIGLLALLGISLYFYREKVKRNKIIASQKETLNELNTTKDKLFSILSHDLRSSVNALKSSNKILIDNLASKNLNALENLLQKNSSIVNGAYGLLDNLLNWALLQTKQQYFHIDKHRLFIITEHVAYNYKPLLLEKELVFENTVSKKEIIYADQESLKIVLRNLLDNAIKFSKPNGSIKVYSRNISDDYCDLIVEDTGLGMSEETRLKLLEDSVLLNKKEHENVIGTGLGLQLCKSMIKKNNGKFTIESELGKGTKMIVSLPKFSLNEQH